MMSSSLPTSLWHSFVVRQRNGASDYYDGQAAAVVIGLATNFSSEFNFKLSN